MKTIKPFIDLGFYTVPLEGELKRLEDGKKTIPVFEKNWKAKYSNTFNTKATKLGGAITGAISNIIAIDCDDQYTYDLFRAIDPTNKFVFVSKGKPSGGGTILYRYPTDIELESFSINNDVTHLDFYANNGFIYLPSERNETKEQIKKLPVLTDAPSAVIQLIRTYYYQYTLGKSKNTEIPIQAKYTNYLSPQIDLLLLKKQFIPSLFRVLTPKDFRTEPQYTKLGYLHPNEVPEGRGSEYLSKISAILGKDSSIDHDSYIKTMVLINNMWDEPMETKKFESTILDPMISGSASIDGEPIWQYDEHWKSRGLAFTTKLGDAMEVFYDDIRASYYVLNYTTSMMKVFHRDTDMFGYIEPVAQALPVRKEIKMIVPVVRTTIQPSLPFGFFGEDMYTRQFNVFMQTPALAIINNPDTYAGMYVRPNTILQFLNSFIPDQVTRNYVLGFLKMKFTTFKYSPVALYFLGAHGSGKDTFVRILADILGEQYLARPTAKEFIEQFNGWLVDKYFVQLDEYGNQLHTLQDKEIALGKIKAYTGKRAVQIRQMRTDGFNYEHLATFILTANSNPLIVEDGDRRVCLIDTPNVLKNTEWVMEMGGASAVIEAIDKEVNDFAYYLATEVNSISMDEYMTPPESAHKQELIAEHLPAAQKLAYIFRHGMYPLLEELVEETGYFNILRHSGDARIFEEDLMELYSHMTEGRGTSRGLAKILKQNDFDKIPTTRGGTKQYYYHIPSLSYYKPTIEEVSSINEEPAVQPRGL